MSLSQSPVTDGPKDLQHVKVTCQSCGARYGIADAKIRGRRAKVRCKSCKAVFVVDGTALDPDAEPMRESMAPSMSLPPPEPDAGVYDAPSGPELVSSPSAADATNATNATNAAPAGEHPPPADEAAAPDPNLWSVSVSDDDERTLTSEELVAGLAAGELGEDPYIWRDGMGDWAPPTQVPEIAALLEGGMVDAGAAPVPVGTDTDPSEPFASAPPAADPAMGDGPTPAPFATPESEPQIETNANYVPVAEAEPTPAPFETNTDYAPVAPAQSDSSPEPVPAPVMAAPVDLFAGVDRAGSEEDVIASVPPPPPAIPTTKTGERNETSVLFTLDSLKAAAGGGAAPPQAAAAPPPRLADLVGGSSGTFGEDADLATLAAPIAEEVVTTSAVGGQPPPAKSKKGLFIAAAAAVLVVAGVGIAMSSGGDDNKDSGATAINTPAKTDEAPTQAGGATKKADEPKTAEAPKPADGVQPAGGDVPPSGDKAEPEAGDAAATAALAETAKPADKAPPKAATNKPKKRAPKPRKVTKRKPKPKPKPEPKKSLTGGKPPFNMKAAKKALSSAARRAKGCKRAGGPTGKVKVSVTFSNSGRTTSSKVVAGPVRGTLIGGCVATAFRKTKVPAFSGPRKTIPVSFRMK